ncbi:RNA polymerase sigma factor [Arachidicoccus terrestris]|uniref:RNA polymerase sigma factor n=1 Tax=Arachidicoccus terrestris TaxID=2875539 RepID=UPI001CC4D4D9|nr:sigma-70 family RNA polymerase sigma factor [Arachidicoccus terrestris]UAY55501.1 sigma-70 family RNA polymerase sigma factor [Arachidicoccus terrestris]
MVNIKRLVISKEDYIQLNVLSDIELINRWNLGEEAAFAVFYKRRVKALVHLAFIKTADAAVAEEIVQDSFLKFYQHRGTPFLNPLGYLKVVLKNKVIDYYRKEASSMSAISIDAAPEAVSKNDPASALIAKEQYALLYEAIDQLPKKCGEVFKLRRLSDLSNKEVANRLGLSVNTVEQHMRRAIRLLSRMGLLLFIYFFSVI